MNEDRETTERFPGGKAAPTPEGAGREWWAEQWTDLLESYRFKKRLERARTYAREGNVLEVRFDREEIIARVRGTAPEPYRVSISLEPLGEEQWGWVVETLTEKPLFAAKLLAGEMPPNIEDAIFAPNGVRLFPFQLSEVRSRCTCPDKANPCKHVGAVYYLLADRFSEDPFVLFRLRGRSKEEILSALRNRENEAAEVTAEIGVEPAAELTSEMAIAPIPVDLDRFWTYDSPLESSLVVIAPPVGDETVLDVLGPVPIPVEDLSLSRETNVSSVLSAALRAIYQKASQEAIAAGLSAT